MRATLYALLCLLLVPPASFPSAFLRSRHCGPIDTRRCRSNRFPRRLVRYIPDAITGSAICHAATPADISEYPPVIMRFFVKFTHEEQSLEIEPRYPAARLTKKKSRGYFQRKRAPSKYPPAHLIPFPQTNLSCEYSGYERVKQTNATLGDRQCARSFEIAQQKNIRRR